MRLALRFLSSLHEGSRRCVIYYNAGTGGRKRRLENGQQRNLPYVSLAWQKQSYEIPFQETRWHGSAHALMHCGSVGKVEASAAVWGDQVRVYRSRGPAQISRREAAEKKVDSRAHG